MKLTFINVGYGDSILIENNDPKEKFVILIDGGKPEDEHYLGFTGRTKTVELLKKKGIVRIDLMVISHLHEDHTGGLLDVVRSFEVDEMWCNYIVPEEFMNRKIEFANGYGDGALKLLNSINIFNEIYSILKGRSKRIRKIRGISLNQAVWGHLNADIFGPSDTAYERLKGLMAKIYTEEDVVQKEKALVELDDFINNTSIVLRLGIHDKKILLGGDVYNTYWDDILRNSISIKADILKLPHHGHMDSVSEKMIEAVSPEYVVICVSNDRPDNCPNPEVMEMFKRFGKKHDRRIGFFFTDAVNMPPYASSDLKHKAIVFNLEYGKEMEYEFLD